MLIKFYKKLRNHEWDLIHLYELFIIYKLKMIKREIIENKNKKGDDVERAKKERDDYVISKNGIKKTDTKIK